MNIRPVNIRPMSNRPMSNRWRFLKHTFICLALVTLSGVSSISSADESPALAIKSAVNSLVDSFSANREQLEDDRKQLFDLVDRIASPLFDFDFISKLILAANWKKASEQQRQDFAYELKRLLIATYAIALFRYTGNEALTFDEVSIKERESARFATVRGQFRASDGTPFKLVYSMVQKQGENWKIYNLAVADLDMVLNYRSVFQSSVHQHGLDGTITQMQTNNDKIYSE